MDSEARVVTEEMHPDPPGNVHLGICSAMIVAGVALVAIGAVFGGLWGVLRVVLVLAGVVVLTLGFLLALGVTNVKVGASRTGGIEATAEIPKGYTKTMRISESLTEGSNPPKQGTMPPKVGVMPPKQGTMP